MRYSKRFKWLLLIVIAIVVSCALTVLALSLLRTPEKTASSDVQKDSPQQTAEIREKTEAGQKLVEKSRGHPNPDDLLNEPAKYTINDITIYGAVIQTNNGYHVQSFERNSKGLELDLTAHNINPDAFPNVRSNTTLPQPGGDRVPGMVTGLKGPMKLTGRIKALNLGEPPVFVVASMSQDLSN